MTDFGPYLFLESRQINSINVRNIKNFFEIMLIKFIIPSELLKIFYNHIQHFSFKSSFAYCTIFLFSSIYRFSYDSIYKSQSYIISQSLRLQ